MLKLSEMNKLSAGGRSGEHFFHSQIKRSLDSDRMKSFLTLCPLLGEPLNASKWHLLKDADIVGNLPFLMGGDTVKSGNEAAKVKVAPPPLESTFGHDC